MNRANDYKQSEIENLYKNRSHFWFFHRNKIIFDAIAKYCKKSKEDTYILEIGTGAGNISCYLKDKGYKIDASDMYDSALNYMKRKVDGVFIFDLISDKIPCKNLYKYDIVILGDVIEHLENPVSALKKINNFLKRGGAILVTVPALMQLWTPYDNFCGHKKRYNRSNLKKELKDSGYQVQEIKYFMFIPAIILLFQRKFKSVFKKTEKSFSNELRINSFINNFMGFIMSIEYKFGKIINYPFGSSVIIVGKKG